MITIGNIIIDDGITGIPSTFKILKMGDYLNNTDNLPTLVIGWEIVKNSFLESSILNKKIKENLYWTFSPTEKRNHFEEDLKSFIKKSYNDYVKNIKYFNLDPLMLKINSTEEFIQKIKNIEGGFTYLYSNKIVYIFHNFTIFSIDLEQIDFIGFDREKIINSLKELTRFFNNEEEKIFKNELKYIDVKYLPYLIFCNDTTKDITSSVIC